MHEPSFAALRLPHFYRSLAPLWRCKHEIEHALFARGLDLFNSELDLVFFDTTSTYFEGRQFEGWTKLGKSKDHRPDHLQLIIGVVMRRDGIPVCCEIWPGNTADVTTVVPIIDALKQRFLRSHLCVLPRALSRRAAATEACRSEAVDPVGRGHSRSVLRARRDGAPRR